MADHFTRVSSKQLPSGRGPVVAIIGIGCRFPGGATDPGALWDLLRYGVDAITEIPPDRWHVDGFYDADPAAPGKMTARYGGFIRDIDQFDAQFFGMSPREAARADPQQRILLEVAYEALEDAGQASDQLAGTPVGVFIGISSYDYGAVQAGVGGRPLIDAYTNLGGALSIAANRISYAFNFTGPSVAIDTACSSSLVAVHLACQSLAAGESALALAGGVNIVLKPETMIGFSKASMLAPDGRCKSFDARANGYVRAEGAGIVVLKPLARAVSDGDVVYAVIRGTAVNQDGRTHGISVPSRRAQERLLREACQRAGVSPQQVNYCEAHGTGTPVGDPIEACAIGNVLGTDRGDGRDCLLGSVKSNIGHLEAASGVAGLIKAALCLKHGMIPANLHFDTPNPRIPFEALRLRVPRTLEDWPDVGDGPRVAAVNSFGFGGTNANAILVAAPSSPEPDVPPPTPEPTRALLLPLSAKSPAALRASAQSYVRLLEDDLPGARASLHDVCYTASVRRSHHEHRLAMVFRSRAELIEQLELLLADRAGARTAWGGKARRGGPQIAFIFSGMGPQWWAMGRELLAAEPVFREALERCDSLLRRYVPWSLVEELGADEAHSRIHHSRIAQPAGFSLQVALTALWQSWGIAPDAVLGHSVGEVAAAHAAGVLSLEDAIHLISHRSRLQDRTAGRGKMLAVAVGRDRLEPLTRGYEGRISIAAINSPSSATLAGDREVLEAIADRLRREEVFCRFLQVDVPYHSPAMDPLEAELLEALHGLRPGVARVPLYSGTVAQSMTGREMDAAYWWRNVRDPVLFASALEQVIAAGCDVFLEIGPHPVLGSFVAESLTAARRDGLCLPSLRRGQSDRAVMLSSLGTLYTAGADVDWRRLYPQGRVVPVPRYAWQRGRHWSEPAESSEDRLGRNAHPLLGRRLTSAYPTWTIDLESHHLAYLHDHRYRQDALVPAAAYVEMAIAAVAKISGKVSCLLTGMEFSKPRWLRAAEPTRLQVICDPRHSSVAVCSALPDAGAPWTHHAGGDYRPVPDSSAEASPSLELLRGRCTREIRRDDCYGILDGVGLRYGARFQTIQRLWGGAGEALGRIEAQGVSPDEVAGYHFHPTVLDGCFQVLLGALHAHDGLRMTAYLPVEIERIRVHAPASSQVWSHARVIEQSASRLRGDITIFDPDGRVLAEIHGLRCQAVDGHQARSEPVDDYLYRYEWTLQDLPHTGRARRAADDLPSPSDIAGDVRSAAADLNRALARRSYYEHVRPLVDSLCTMYVLEAFGSLGWRAVQGERFSTESLARRLEVRAPHHRLFGRLLDMLGEDGVLSASGGEWMVRHVPRAHRLEPAWRTLLSRYPAYGAELTLLERCGRRLAQVLRGEVDPRGLIAPHGGDATVEHLYQDAPHRRLYNGLVERTVKAATDRLPHGGTVRILEISAGAGGVIRYVAPVLPSRGTEYLFTDAAPESDSLADKTLQRYPFAAYRRLDIEDDPIRQGFDEGSIDLVVAADALHWTRDLFETLTNVRRLLAPNALLAVLEITNPPRWADLVFGLLSGWWRFSDVDVRPSHCCLPFPEWKHVLTKTGFGDITGVCDTERETDAEHTLILARANAAAAPEDRRGLPPAVDRDSARDDAGGWLILADEAGVGDELAARMKARHQQAFVVHHGWDDEPLGAGPARIDPRDPRHFVRLVQAARSREALRGVIHLWSLDTGRERAATAASLDADQVLGCVSVLHLVRALNELSGGGSPALWLVTRGAQPVGDGAPISIAQSPLWGLGRVIQNEQPAYQTRLVDLSPDPTAEDIEALLEEVSSGTPEDEIALRGRRRYVHRLMPVSISDIGGEQANTPAPGVRPSRLEIGAPGLLDTLRFRTATRERLETAQVEIEVQAAALNFKDVAKAMGLLSDPTLGNTASETALGLECAGTITAIGEDVKDFEVGDEVAALAPHSLGRYAVTDARFVMRKPPCLTFEEAAGIPLVFLTAHYALHHLARLRRGERVLIHAATGGVGLAAIQVARRLGAEIFATAGSSEKREFLSALGVRHVMDSRSLSFGEEVLARTDGQGVDVVLNSLTGDALRCSLTLLAPGGRFVELGKRDIEQNTKLGLRLFQDNLSFFAVDLDRISLQRPDFIHRMLRDVMRLFERCKLVALAHRVFPASDVVTAFRHLLQARHIGKVVVSMRDPGPVWPSEPGDYRLREDGTYLITGGLGGFGRVVAAWMVARGARHLVLMGRSGASSSAAQSAVDDLRRGGVEVRVEKADVAHEGQVAATLRDVRRSMPPLRGVVHAAMILDDVEVRQLTDGRFRTVMLPKMRGAWNLHTETVDAPLDFFVMFSSVASLVGNPGQGSYAAANAFLDALAHHRRRDRLPALTINWGPVDIGYVAERAGMEAHLARLGAKLLPSALGLRILGQLLDAGAAQVAVMAGDWQRWEALHPAGRSPRFAGVVRGESAGQASAIHPDRRGDSLRDAVAAAVPTDRQALIEAYLCEQIATVMSISPSALEVEGPLTDLGLDSLMAMELVNRLERDLQVNVPAIKFLDGLSVTSLATYTLDQLAPAGGRGGPTSTPPGDDDVVARLDDMSDEAIDGLLEHMLRDSETDSRPDPDDRRNEDNSRQ